MNPNQSNSQQPQEGQKQHDQPRAPESRQETGQASVQQDEEGEDEYQSEEFLQFMRDFRALLSDVIEDDIEDLDDEQVLMLAADEIKKIKKMKKMEHGTG